MTDCEGQADMAQCQFECEMTLGIDNEVTAKHWNSFYHLYLKIAAHHVTVKKRSFTQPSHHIDTTSSHHLSPK